ncbi:nucleotidyltransferase domain-containing protein [Niabella sp.]|uniref:nucleotidyltransferase domain-containing protein n=1 Tax=Niabella sp. TaxID=1962976 RepID=UPI0026022F12|nr:nucleotidyltransferase domain-containing protein [Niabella sp.]
MTFIEKQIKAAGISLPRQKQQLLQQVVDALAPIEGVAAIVLGGSYAQGAATKESDMDIGLYYMPDRPFDTGSIRQVAGRFATETPAVTGFYEWGPWVNGGAWIQTTAGKVDFLYRNIEQVTQTIENAQSGKWKNHFEQQPPYGFSSLFYLAETQCCIPLMDDQGIIARLKETSKTYPSQLKKNVVTQTLWSAEFTIWNAGKFAATGDVYSTVGCLTRAVKDIVSALFAINGLYPMGDKRAIVQLEAAPLKPARLTDKVAQILCADPHTLKKSVQLLQALHREVVALSAPLYEPLFRLPD